MIRLISVLFLLVLAGCKPSLPKDVLPPEKMQTVFWDLTRADEYCNYKVTFDSSWASAEKHEELYQQVFAIHKVSKEQFKKSLRYYQSNPRYLKIVLDSLQNAGDKQSPRPDSIMRYRKLLGDTTRFNDTRQ